MPSMRPVISSSSPPGYIAPASRQLYPLGEPRWKSEDGRPLMITKLAGIGRDEIQTGRRSLWRYAKSFPLDVTEPVTMGECRYVRTCETSSLIALLGQKG
jgi:hypothetical protein